MESAQSKILIIEDSLLHQATLRGLLLSSDVEIYSAHDGESGLSTALSTSPDMILLDIELPDINGFQLCGLIRDNPQLADIPIIMIAGNEDVESRVAAFEQGADEVLQRPFHQAELRAIVANVARLNRFRKMAEHRAEVEGMLQQIEAAYDATIEGWVKALDLRDQETEGHSIRVAFMAVELAESMGYSSEKLVHLRRGALLHDIGKLGIPDAILHKDGAFSEEERMEMQRHTEYAYSMLSNIEYLAPAIAIPYCHHEKWDGTGYPRGLKGEEIPLEARIFSVIDVYDALICHRSYKEGWSEQKVLAYIAAMSGSYFDEQVVQAFINLRSQHNQLAEAV